MHEHVPACTLIFLPVYAFHSTMRGSPDWNIHVRWHHSTAILLVNMSVTASSRNRYGACCTVERNEFGTRSRHKMCNSLGGIFEILVLVSARFLHDPLKSQLFAQLWSRIKTGAPSHPPENDRQRLQGTKDSRHCCLCYRKNTSYLCDREGWAQWLDISVAYELHRKATMTTQLSKPTEWFDRSCKRKKWGCVSAPIHEWCIVYGVMG